MGRFDRSDTEYTTVIAGPEAMTVSVHGAWFSMRSGGTYQCTECNVDMDLSLQVGHQRACTEACKHCNGRGYVTVIGVDADWGTKKKRQPCPRPGCARQGNTTNRPTYGLVVDDPAPIPEAAVKSIKFIGTTKALTNQVDDMRYATTGIAIAMAQYKGIIALAQYKGADDD